MESYMIYVKNKIRKRTFTSVNSNYCISQRHVNNLPVYHFNTYVIKKYYLQTLIAVFLRQNSNEQRLIASM